MKREKKREIPYHKTADKSQWSVKLQYSLVKTQSLVCHRKYFISSLILGAVPQQLHVWLRASRAGEFHETAIAIKFSGFSVL